MIPNLSKIGVQMSSLTGAKTIAKDIIETLPNKQKQDFINLSAGKINVFVLA
uniref:Valine--pyruvate transaminase n=1 Tax=Nostoc sp. HIID-D1B TaxID=2027338 RepID=A0A2P1CZ90_9NOSO